jgi:hypothetical protein
MSMYQYIFTTVLVIIPMTIIRVNFDACAGLDFSFGIWFYRDFASPSCYEMCSTKQPSSMKHLCR